jgi:hypothetical protein
LLLVEVVEGEFQFKHQLFLEVKVVEAAALGDLEQEQFQCKLHLIL